MRAQQLSQLSDQVLLHKLAKAASQERQSISALLALIAEVDTRRLYVPAGCSSMFTYCVEKLHLSDDAAYRRIRAARTARQFPVVLEFLAAGRLNLTSVNLLAPYLTTGNAAALFAAAEGKNKKKIELLLAARFPAPDVPARIRAIRQAKQLTPAPVEAAARGPELATAPVEPAASGQKLALAPVEAAASGLELAPAPVETPACDQKAAPPAKIKPLAPKRFALQATVDQHTHDKLRYAQELLSHQLPSGDIAQVLALALDALVEKLEKRKFAATDKPRRTSSRPTAKRTIPARVKRAVWKRDGEQCTFVAKSGHRCSARKFLEFDHVDPVARGGEATVETMRLRCRAHNQYEAEQVFGAEFMRSKHAAEPTRAFRARQRGTSPVTKHG